MQIIGERIIERRIHLHYTQKYLAEICNISRDRLYRLERNKLKTSVSNVLCEQLANSLQCTMDYLTGLSEHPTTHHDGKIDPFSIDPRILNSNVLFSKLMEKDPQLAKDIAFMYNHFSAEELLLVKHLLAVLRKNHEEKET